MKIFLLALLIRIVLVPLGLHSDLQYHADWGKRFYDYGPKEFYQGNVWSLEWPNQPPGTIYLVALSHKLYETTFNLLWQINISFKSFPSGIMSWYENFGAFHTLKVFSITSDLILGVIIYRLVKLLKNKTAGKLALILFLFNPAVIYNSSIWGQTDSLLGVFGLLTLYFFMQKNIIFSLLFFALGFLLKPSLLIWLPAIAIWITANYRQNIKQIIIASLLTLTLILILTLPFTPINKNPVNFLVNDIYQGKVFNRQLPVVTANAFNLWGAIFSFQPIHDSNTFFTLSYRVWGFIIGGTFYLWLSIKQIRDSQNFNYFLWTLFLQTFVSFLFFTRMHDRYLYPALPLIAVLTALSMKEMWKYILLTAIHTLNLYHLWWMPSLFGLKKLFLAQNYLLGRILSLFLILTFIIYFFSHHPYSKKSNIEAQ